LATNTVQERKLISSGSPFEPILGFSRAVRVGNVLAVSGTAPMKDGKTASPGDPAGQARRCLEIIEETLRSAGVSLKNVVRTRVFLTRIDDWEAVGRVHGSVFGNIRPACTFVQVSRLIDPDWLVEIEADAVIPDHE
jgi:enamine deaminase RidA (YjgF/YER057c/UK114 family)